MTIETVQDLINYLSTFPPDSQVYDIDGMSIVPKYKICVHGLIKYVTEDCPYDHSKRKERPSQEYHI